MDFGINGKQALVLGSTRGLGRGIAEALAGEGARVIITGRNLADAQQAAAEITATAVATVQGLAYDATDPAAPAMLVTAARALTDQVDILVLNGGGPPPGPITAVESETWRRQFQAQFLSFVELAGAFVPSMRAAGWGRVIVSSSSGVEQPIANLGISNSLRGGLLGWAKTLATEVAADGVTVNTLLPGRIQTTRIDEIDNDTAARSGRPIEEVKAASIATIPAGRLGTPAEYGAAAAFLASVQAAFITGSIVRVDGGMTRSV